MMRKAILYPFNSFENNTRSFLCVMALAEDLKAPVICYTFLPKESNDADIDRAYMHILRLKGVYQTYINSWDSKEKPQVKTVVYQETAQKKTALFKDVNFFNLTIIQGSNETA